MKSSFLRKEISRREMLGWSTSLAGSPLLAHVSFPGLLGASVAGNPQHAPSPADLLAAMRAQFSAAPLKTQKLSESLTMFSGPGGSVVVLNGPDGKFTGLAQAQEGSRWPRQRASEICH